MGGLSDRQEPGRGYRGEDWVMRAYVAVDVADVCYPYEAAAWVALGRIPEVLFSERGSEARCDFFSTSQGDTRPPPTTALSDDELTLFTGGEAGTLRYTQAKYVDPGVGNVDEFFNGAAGLHATLRGAVTQGPRCEAGFHEAVFAEEIDRRISHSLDRAQVEVLMALMRGSISATGFKIPEDWKYVDEASWPEEIWDEMEGLSSSPIPASEWANIPEIWEDDPANLRTANFLYPVLSVPDLLEAFDDSRVGDVVTGLRIGGTTLIHVGGGSGLSRKLTAPRGRQMKAGGVIKHAVEHEFSNRLKAGVLPEKSDAVCQEAMDWSMLALGEKISRTTAQRYLAPILSARKSSP